MTHNQQQQDPDPMTITHLLAPPVTTFFHEGSRPSSRPPSYKLDTHIDLDALETHLQCSVQSQHKRLASKWRYQFHGTPLVFWLILFVFIGIVSLFMPSHLPTIVALTLWLPFFLYMVGFCLFHTIYRHKKPDRRDLQKLHAQLAVIRRHRQRVLTRVSEPPTEDLYFLYANSDQYTHPVITLLPPPPAYQRKEG